MKRILSITGILTFVFLLLTAFSIRENPQDPPRGKKIKKHIKMVTVDENGKKVELDTVFENNNVFIWNGDTVNGGKEFKWTNKEDFDFNLDSLQESFNIDFDYEIEDDGEGRVIIMKSGNGGKPMIHEFKMDGDSSHKFLVKIR